MTISLGIDATPLTQTRTGVGNYTHELIHALAASEDRPQMTLLSNRPIFGRYEQLGHIQENHFPSNWLWMQLRLPRLLAESDLQLVHFPNNALPLASPVPTVLTIHDASLFLYPHHHPWRRRLALRTIMRHAALKADAIITVSHYAKANLSQFLPVPPEKIQVIHEAAGSQFRQPITCQQRITIRKKYQLPDNFLLYVGTLEPRKNLARLLQAYARLLGVQPAYKSIPLVIAGLEGWGAHSLAQQIAENRLQQHVHYIGFVDEADLPALYSAAKLFVFPSLHEGFGLPPLEAMACGTPVLTSQGSAMQEICGAAAHYVDPLSVDALTDAMHCLLSHPDRLHLLGEAGRRRSAEFSWQKSAQQTLTLYHALLAA